MAEPTQAEKIKAAAEMSLMYLQTGFIECPQCGEEVQTKTLDAAYELATVVEPAPTIGGTIRSEPVPETGQAGEVAKAYTAGFEQGWEWPRETSPTEAAERYARGYVAALATQPATSQEKDDMTSSNTLADCFVDNWQRECTDGRVTKHTDMMVRQFAYYAFAHLPQPYREHTPAQPATSQEGEDEDAIHDCGNLGWCQAPGYCSRHDIAALATQPDDRN